MVTLSDANYNDNTWGFSISDYVQETRIKLARQLLQDPGIKNYEVAEQVGIQTSAYFTYLFKKIVGCTPQEFRNYHYTEVNTVDRWMLIRPYSAFKWTINPLYFNSFMMRWS